MDNRRQYTPNREISPLQLWVYKLGIQIFFWLFLVRLFFPFVSSGYYINVVILIHGHWFNRLGLFCCCYCFVMLLLLLFYKPGQSDLLWASSMFMRVSGPPKVHLSGLPTVDSLLFPKTDLVPRKSEHEGLEREDGEHVMRQWSLPNATPFSAQPPAALHALAMLLTHLCWQQPHCLPRSFWGPDSPLAYGLIAVVFQLPISRI